MYVWAGKKYIQGLVLSMVSHMPWGPWNTPLVDEWGLQYEKIGNLEFTSPEEGFTLLGKVVWLGWEGSRNLRVLILGAGKQSITVNMDEDRCDKVGMRTRRRLWLGPVAASRFPRWCSPGDVVQNLAMCAATLVRKQVCWSRRRGLWQRPLNTEMAPELAGRRNIWRQQQGIRKMLLATLYSPSLYKARL